MSTKPSIVAFIVDQLGERITAKRMFGEYGLYRDGLLIALVCDDQLFMKPTDAGRAWIAAAGAVEEAPPYPNAKPSLLISADQWDDAEWMRELASVTAEGLSAVAATKAARKTRATKTKGR